MMMVGSKRQLSFEERVDQLQKRCRYDAPPLGLQAGLLLADLPGLCAELDVTDRRRQHPLDDELIEPVDKRHRVSTFLDGARADGDSCACGSSTGSGVCGSSSGVMGNETHEAALQSWAGNIVSSLHGCPSVEEAVARCARSLADFETESRRVYEATHQDEAALSPAPVDNREADRRQGSPAAAATEELQIKNKVLLKAVHHLAERYRKLEANSGEIAALQQALEQSHEVQRRLSHSNDMLQAHLKLHIDGQC